MTTTSVSKRSSLLCKAVVAAMINKNGRGNSTNSSNESGNGTNEVGGNTNNTGVGRETKNASDGRENIKSTKRTRPNKEGMAAIKSTKRSRCVPCTTTGGKDTTRERFRWNDQTDEWLRQGFEIHGENIPRGFRGANQDGWVSIAAYINGKIGKDAVTNDSAQSRWYQQVNPETAAILALNRPTVWDEAELALLRQAEESHPGAWHEIQSIVGTRTAKQCYNKAKSLRNEEERAKLNTGPFTATEDETLIRMKLEFDQAGKRGLWRAVGEALGKPLDKCCKRWYNVLSKRA